MWTATGKKKKQNKTPMHTCSYFILKHGHCEILSTSLTPKAGLICSSVYMVIRAQIKQKKKIMSALYKLPV